MRDRVKDYHIYATNSQVVVRLLTLPNDVVLEEVEGELTPVSTRRVIEAIRLIVDETIGEVFCSSMQKNKIRKVYGSGTSMGVTAACAIEFAQPEGKTANTTDQFTIELDWGDVTAKETTLNSAKEEILTAVDNIKLPEIDTTNIASKDLEKFFGVKPIESYEFMTPEEVCSTLENIMTSMDLELTQEQAAEITSNTLNN